MRNTRVLDIVRELTDYNCQVDIYDPWASSAEAQHEFGITPVERPQPGTYDGIILAVAHQQFKDMGIDAIRAMGRPQHVLYDLKYVLSADSADLRL
ncbi:UDP-glucose/GDP-mannose dehydrogenase family, UDP binding domain [compost metagenome]